MMGWMLVDKPAGVTSHDVVGRVRHAARTRRVGHAGTLDPFATGLVVVAVGSATRLLPYIDAEPKVYEAVIRFGAETETDDSTGEIIREAPVPPAAGIPDAIAALTGALQQTPPAYSAKHVDGQRAYALARRGAAVTLAPVPVTVHQWELLAWRGADLEVRISCAGGTYIRALARDLGRLVNSAAHCAELRRTSSGAARIGDAVPWHALAPGAIADGAVPLWPARRLLDHLTAIPLDADGSAAVRMGRTVPAQDPSASRGVFVDGDVVVGIGEIVPDLHGAPRWQPRVVLPPEPTVEAA